MTDMADFLERVQMFPASQTDCWLWTGTRGSGGYGYFKGNTAHRWSYRNLVGEIPEGLHIDHLCSVKRCVNPKHLEPVTQQENNRRAKERRRSRTSEVAA